MSDSKIDKDLQDVILKSKGRGTIKIINFLGIKHILKIIK